MNLSQTLHAFSNYRGHPRVKVPIAGSHLEIPPPSPFKVRQVIGLLNASNMGSLSNHTVRGNFIICVVGS